MRRLVTLGLAGMLVLSACGGADSGSPSTTPTTTSLAPSTSSMTPPTTTATTSTTTVSTTQQPHIVPPLLLADAAGIRVIGSGEQPEIRFSIEAAALAVPDLQGGVVFQREVRHPTGLRWDDVMGRNVFEWAEGAPEPIWHLAGPGASATAVVSHDDAELTLVDVVEIGGHPNVLYRMLIGGPGGDEAWHQVFGWLCLYDLMSGETRMLGLIGSYESSLTRIRFGGDLAAVAFDPYADSHGTLIGFVPVAVLGGDAEYNWLPSLVAADLTLGPGTECAGDLDCTGWALATAASDGSRISWVQSATGWADGGPRQILPVEVMMVDRASGVVSQRTELAPVAPDDDPSGQARFIDDDGATIVISGVGTTSDVAVVAADGGVAYLGMPGATASLWESTVSTHTDPIVKEMLLVLRGDTLGLVSFGTPTEDVLSLLEVEIGPPSRDGFDMYHAVSWDDLALTLLFSPHDFYRDDGVEHLVGWSHWSGVVTSLRTSRGIGLGDTFADLTAVHGDQVTIPTGEDECMPPWFVWLNDPSADIDSRMLVILDGPPDAAGTRVTYMSAGASYGC